MAQTNVQVPITVGIPLDAFATSGTGNLRETVVLGDSATDAAVAPVVNTAPVGSAYGVFVRPLATANSGPGAAASMVNSTVLEASHVIKASAGNLYGIFGYSNKAS